jgi:hypothetical protein
MDKTDFPPRQFHESTEVGDACHNSFNHTANLNGHADRFSSLKTLFLQPYYTLAAEKVSRKTVIN